MSKQKKYHYIYKTTCQVTGKFYVGMHSTDNLEDGYIGSGKILGYSISKHGKENHVKEILEHCSSRDELKKREKEIVNEELLQNPLNINLKYGGEGGGKLWSEEHKQKFIDAGTTASLLRRSADSAFKQLVYSKIVNTKRNRNSFYRPVNNTFIATGATAKAALPEAIEKRKNTFKERDHSKGEKNSQFGIKRISLVKDGITKRINKLEYQSYIDDGWLPKVKTVSNRQLKYDALEKEFSALRPKCRNIKCNSNLTFKQFCGGNTSCSKACSNASRN